MILMGNDAKLIIGVDYAATFSGLSELIASMEGERRGPTDARINKMALESFKQSVKSEAASAAVRAQAEMFKDSVPELLKQDKKAIKVWADDDGELSIERYLNDEERYWKRTKRPRRKNKTMRLMAEISATGWSTDAELTIRCSTIVSMAAWLADEGYEVEVLAADYSIAFLNDGNPKNSELGTVIVKQASETLDIDNLAGILCSQNFGYEVLLRGIVHNCPKAVRPHWGYVEPIPANVLKALDVDVSVPRDILTVSKASAWLSREIKRLSTPEH